MRRLKARPSRRRTAPRAGLASLDYVLILGTCFVLLATVIVPIGPRILRLAYEMVSVLVSWPFM